MLIDKQVCMLETEDLLVISREEMPLLTAAFLFCFALGFGPEVGMVTAELNHPIYADYNEEVPVWLGMDAQPWAPGPI